MESEYDIADNLSLRPDQYSKSVSTPGRRNSLAVLADVPTLNSVSKKDITRDIAVDETDVEIANVRLTAPGGSDP